MDFEVETWDVSTEATELNNSLFKNRHGLSSKKKKKQKLVDTERKDVENQELEKNFSKLGDKFSSADTKLGLADKPGKKRKRKKQKDGGNMDTPQGKLVEQERISAFNFDTVMSKSIKNKEKSARSVHEHEDEIGNPSPSKKKKKSNKMEYCQLVDVEMNGGSNKDKKRKSTVDESDLFPVAKVTEGCENDLKKTFADFNYSSAEKKKKRKDKKNEIKDHLVLVNKHKSVSVSGEDSSMDAVRNEYDVKSNHSKNISGLDKDKSCHLQTEALKYGQDEVVGNKKKKRRKKKKKTNNGAVSDDTCTKGLEDNSKTTAKDTQKNGKHIETTAGTDKISQHTNKSPTFNRQKLLQILEKHDKSLNKNTVVTNRINNTKDFTRISNSTKTTAKKKQLKYRHSESDSDENSSDPEENLHQLQYSKHEKKRSSVKITDSAKTTKKSLLQQNVERLEAARFRFINEQLYVRTGAEALEMFNSDPDAFHVYHKGFQSQVEKWPVNPLDVIIDFVKSQPIRKVVADFGCGDAKLAQSVPQKVHSFDLVAVNKYVTVCDISKVPLPDGVVDIAVFCLSLMGTNFSSYLKEANRVLKKGGTLVIAEVSSRFGKLRGFTDDVQSLGFHPIDQETDNSMFVMMKFQKRSDVKNKVIRSMKLKPCVYKKR